MEQITFDQFSEKYSVRRNPLRQISNYGNTMLDIDEEEVEEVENSNPKMIWTLKENKNANLTLEPGMIYKNAIGYFMCKNEWQSNKECYLLI